MDKLYGYSWVGHIYAMNMEKEQSQALSKIIVAWYNGVL